jgi:DNA-binding phage protein
MWPTILWPAHAPQMSHEASSILDFIHPDGDLIVVKERMGATEIAKAVGCKRGNIYKTLKAAGLN